METDQDPQWEFYSVINCLVSDFVLCRISWRHKSSFKPSKRFAWKDNQCGDTKINRAISMLLSIIKHGLT